MMIRRRNAAVAAAALVLAAGCPGSGTRTLSRTRVATLATKPVKPEATSAERFDMGQHFGAPKGAAPQGKRSPLGCDTPQGWESKPDPSGMRLASFTVAGHPEADCSITILPGGVQGIAANVNRWRKQMGLPEQDGQAVQQLPTRQILGGAAILVELEGAYAGMGNQAPQQGWKLLGAIRPLQTAEGESTLFVKFVGPAAVIDGERASFSKLCDSLRVEAEEPEEGDEPQNPHGDTPPPGHPTGVPAQPPAAQLQWQAPQGWVQAGQRPMRLVTFVAGASQQSECYVTVLPGNAGGLEANFNRWRGQMGQPPLDPQAIASLPKTKVLGEDAPLMEAAGQFTDTMGGGGTKAGWLMLAVIVPQKDRTVFVKMLGPEAEVRAERERFQAFLGSLK